MKCWACKRQARGYGHTDSRRDMGNLRRYSIGQVLCSRRCQDAFHVLYGNWQRIREGRVDRTKVTMIDPPDAKLATMRHCLKAFGEAADEVGFTKPLGDYSEAEALQMIDAIVTCWSDTTVARHKSSKFPPVRGLPPTPDPLAPNAVNPFADLEDGLLWEEPKGKRP